MAFSTTISDDGNEAVFHIEGKFDFNMHAEFRDAYRDLPSSTTFIVDLEKTSFIDSSAMGMLLLLREYAGGKAANIILTNCNPSLRKTLSIANLGKIFTIR